MSQHTWESYGVQGGHNGEYHYRCTVCGLRDWLSRHDDPTPGWHADEPCVPVAEKARRVPVPKKVKAKKPKVKTPIYDWQVKERDQVAADWMLEHGFTPERVQLLLRSEELLAAFSEIRPLCVQCGEPGTRQFSTEGDGNYWLCDNLDTMHGVDMYAGRLIAQPALRLWLGTPEPEVCNVCVDDAHADENCENCEGSGWVVPEEP